MTADDGGTSKHVVLIHRYFAPDTPLYAELLRHIAVDLVRAGMRVTVLTATPSYTGAVGGAPRRESLQPGLEIRRAPMIAETRRLGPRRIVNTAMFALMTLWWGLRLPRAHVVMAATTPPVVMGVVGRMIARRHRAEFVYHNQDIYPEVAIAAELLPPGRTASLLRRVDTRTQKRAAAVVVLSDDMKATVERRGVPEDLVQVINNFDPFPPPPGAAGDGQSRWSSPLRVAFAGNLGRFQGLETLVSALALLPEEAIALDLVGDGAHRAELEAQVRRLKLRNVTFHGYLPPDETERVLRDAVALGVITLAPGVIGTAFPSKLFSYLRQGCPVAAAVEPESELARMLVDRGAGFACPPGNVEALAGIFERAVREEGLLEEMSLAALELSREQGEATRLMQWRQLFTSVGATNEPDGSRPLVQ